jgi:TolB-like protein/lipoprotein NlpI
VTDQCKAVFLSYASQDAEAASRICEALRAARIEVWFDQSELRGGDAWDQMIRRQIKACHLFVPMISANTQSREEGYFRREWNLAVARTLDMAEDRAFLLPVVIDGTSDSEARVPEKFREVQWTRLPRGANTDAFVEHVRRLLSRDLSQEPSGTDSVAARAPAAPTSPKPVAASWGTKAALLATIAVAVLTLGYLVADRFVLSKRGAEVGAVPGSATQSAPATGFNPPPHSVAVLPFLNMSADAKQEYFSDGISEELLNSLTRLNELQVAARTSSFSFKGQNVDVSTIARKLNVGAVVEGSVRRSNTKVRITVQLINAVTGFHLWSQTYDRQMSDILKVQTEVATSIAQQLKITLARDDLSRLELGGTKSPEAYDAYLLGMQLLANWDTNDSNDRAALSAFDHAIALDSGYALAYVGRATALVDISIFDAKAPEIPGLREQALKAAAQAVALAPELGEAHWAIAGVYSNGLLDFSRAAPEFDRALALSPGSARVQRGYAGFAGQLGRFQSAIVAGQRAAALDPENADSYVALGQILTWARRYDQALTILHTAALLRPNSVWVKYNIANALLGSGQFESARQLCESDSIPKQGGGRKLCLALAYHGLGRQNDAEKQLEELKIKLGASVELAGLYGQLGDKRAALETLSKAEQERSPDLQVIRVAWELDPIRSEPEFKAIEERLNFPL